MLDTSALAFLSFPQNFPFGASIVTADFSEGIRSKKFASLRVGKVQACFRGRVWSFCYQENSKRQRRRVSPDREPRADWPPKSWPASMV